MPALTSSAVTFVRSAEIGDRTGKYLYTERTLTLNLSSQGGTANTIPVSALGFRVVREVQLVSWVVSSNPRGVVLTLSADGTLIYTYDLNQATDAIRATPADLTGTLTVIIRGIPTS